MTLISNYRKNKAVKGRLCESISVKAFAAVTERNE